MKKIAKILIFALLLSGCAGANKARRDADTRPLVYASFYPMCDFARKIGGDKINLVCMVSDGTEPHDWEPTPALITGLEKADVFIYNGAGMEPWAEKILNTLQNTSLRALEASQGIEYIGGHGGAEAGAHGLGSQEKHDSDNERDPQPLVSQEPLDSREQPGSRESLASHNQTDSHGTLDPHKPLDSQEQPDSRESLASQEQPDSHESLDPHNQTDSHESLDPRSRLASREQPNSHGQLDPRSRLASREQPNSHGQLDPHVWLDPLNAKIQLENIKNILSLAAPEHEKYFTENYNKYAAKLLELDAEFKAALYPLANKDIVVSHAAFGYLCAAYGLNQIPIEGITLDTDPSPAKMAEIITFAREHNVKVIFFETLISPKLAETVAAATGARTEVLSPIEGLSDEERAAGEDYFSIMRKNLKALHGALE